MDAVWNFEDKWKLSTQEAIVFLACTSFLVIGLCTFTAIKRWAKRKRSLVHQDPSLCMDDEAKWSNQAQPSWGSVKNVLLRSVRWSGVSKWEEAQTEKPTPLLVSSRYEANGGWQSRNSTSPVWQRPILMGEKCELPRFSGLILYDQRGRPLHHQSDEGTANYQEESAAAVRTTLRDFL